MTAQPNQSALANDRDPFAVLGLPADPDLTNDQVQEAWQRRLHAERDGGDVEERPAVTEAYEALRSAVRRADILIERDDANVEQGRSVSTDDALVALIAARLGYTAPDEWRAGVDQLALQRADPTGLLDRDRQRSTATEREGRPSSRPSPERLEEVRRRVIAERKKQGLPEFIEDPAILDKIVDILTLGIDYGEDRYQPAEPTRSGLEPGTIPAERGRAGHAPPEQARRLGPLGVLWWRIRRGRPAWLVIRLLLAAAIPAAAYILQPAYPSWIALLVGSATWLAATARNDLAPRPR